MNGAGIPQEVVDLDAPPTGPRERGWGRRHTLWLGVAVVGVAASVATALAWPQPQPGPQVIGLAQPPEIAWSIPLGDSTQVGSCGPGRILTGTSSDRMQLECLDLADGRRIWTTTVDVTAEGAWFGELAGTGLVEVGTASSVVLLDSDTGEVAHRIGTAGQESEAEARSMLLSSDRGTLFWLRATDGADLSRLARPDPGSAVWTLKLDASEVPGVSDERVIVERHDYAWLPDQSEALGSYALAVALDDGSVPDWARSLRTMAVQGNTVVGSTATGLEARDIGSGRVLWSRAVWTERAFASRDGLFVTDRSMTDDVPTPDSHTTWPLSRIDPRTGRALWSVDLPHRVGKAMTLGDTVLALERDPVVTAVDPRTGDLLTGGWRLSAVDAATGAIRWTRGIPGSLFGDVRWGDGQVLVATTAGFSSAGAEVEAIDLVTGATRWDTSLDGFPGVVGGRLITFADGLLAVYR